MTSLFDAFQDYVRQAPEAPGLAAPEDGVDLSRALLSEAIEQFQKSLFEAGLGRGDHVVIAFASPCRFIIGFWAIQALGAVCVPSPPLEGGARRAARLDQASRLCKAAGARALLTELDLTTDELEQLPTVRLVADLSWIRIVDRLVAETGPSPADCAVIQFTSGSTQAPRGCCLSQDAMLRNAVSICNRTGAGPHDRSVCWLPLHHDMGLMSGVIVPVVSGASMVALTPGRFIANPLSWLRHLSGEVRSHTAAPNFALSLVLRRLVRKPVLDIDLSRVATILCGAEPINAGLVRRFMDELAPYGLRREAFHAAYGMAEATVMATSQPEGLRAKAVGEFRSLAAEDRFLEMRSDAELVCVGTPVEGAEVRVVDAAGAPCGEAEIGRVTLRSPSLMAGYFEAREATARVLEDGWLTTDDLGALAGGDLYIVGRADDVITVSGRKLHPTDLEVFIAEAQGLDPARVFAGSRPGADGVRELVILVETRDAVLSDALWGGIRQACHQACGLIPKLALARPGLIQRTTSGKVRRATVQAAIDAHDQTPVLDATT